MTLKIETGAVIAGTLRNEDLLKAFLQSDYEARLLTAREVNTFHSIVQFIQNKLKVRQ